MVKPKKTKIKPGHYQTRKPAIYAYSDEPIKTELTVDPVGEFTYTYPTYNKKWQVTVNSTGKLEVDGKSYDYLFWEGRRSMIDMPEKGFVVEGNNVSKFLDDKLTAIGLNSREKQDFISYWGPELCKNNLNQVSFIFADEYDKEIGKLKSSVPIDTEIRVFMIYKAIDSPIDIEEQVLPSYERKGFTIVEWGGGEVLHPSL